MHPSEKKKKVDKGIVDSSTVEKVMQTRSSSSGSPKTEGKDNQECHKKRSFDTSLHLRGKLPQAVHEYQPLHKESGCISADLKRKRGRPCKTFAASDHQSDVGEISKSSKICRNNIKKCLKSSNVTIEHVPSCDISGIKKKIEKEKEKREQPLRSGKISSVNSKDGDGTLPSSSIKISVTGEKIPTMSTPKTASQGEEKLLEGLALLPSSIRDHTRKIKEEVAICDYFPDSANSEPKVNPKQIKQNSTLENSVSFEQTPETVNMLNDYQKRRVLPHKSSLDTDSTVSEIVLSNVGTRKRGRPPKSNQEFYAVKKKLISKEKAPKTRRKRPHSSTNVSTPVLQVASGGKFNVSDVTESVGKSEKGSASKSTKRSRHSSEEEYCISSGTDSDDVPTSGDVKTPGKGRKSIGVTPDKKLRKLMRLLVQSPGIKIIGEDGKLKTAQLELVARVNPGTESGCSIKKLDNNATCAMSPSKISCAQAFVQVDAGNTHRINLAECKEDKNASDTLTQKVASPEYFKVACKSRVTPVCTDGNKTGLPVEGKSKSHEIDVVSGELPTVSSKINKSNVLEAERAGKSGSSVDYDRDSYCSGSKSNKNPKRIDKSSSKSLETSPDKEFDEDVSDAGSYMYIPLSSFEEDQDDSNVVCSTSDASEIVLKSDQDAEAVNTVGSEGWKSPSSSLFDQPLQWVTVQEKSRILDSGQNNTVIVQTLKSLINKNTDSCSMTDQKGEIEQKSKSDSVASGLQLGSANITASNSKISHGTTWDFTPGMKQKEMLPSEQVFRCKRCLRLFETKESIVHHMRLKKQRPCPICENFYCSPKDWKQHLQTHFDMVLEDQLDGVQLSGTSADEPDDTTVNLGPLSEHGYSCDVSSSRKSGFVCKLCQTFCENPKYIFSHLLDNHCKNPEIVNKFSVIKKVWKTSLFQKRGVDKGKVPQKNVQCSECGMSVKARFIEHHMKGHAVAIKVFICPLCPVLIKFSREQDFLTHQKKHKSVSSQSEKSIHQWKCCQCEFHDVKFTRTVAHWKRNHGKSYECQSCQKSYAYESSLRYHMDSVHSGKKFECPTCGKGFSLKGGLKHHMHTHVGGNKDHKCEYCGMGFTFRRDMLRHQQIHSDLRPFKCSLCARCFRAKKNLDMHFKSHSSLKKHSCETCGKTFARAAYLQEHIFSIHNKVKPYKCGLCSKQFSYRSALTCHQRVHTGYRKYKCPLCESFHLNTAHLKRHLQTHLQFLCPSCGVNCGNADDLIKHLRKHFGNEALMRDKKPVRHLGKSEVVTAVEALTMAHPTLEGPVKFPDDDFNEDEGVVDVDNNSINFNISLDNQKLGSVEQSIITDHTNEFVTVDMAAIVSPAGNLPIKTVPSKNSVTLQGRAVQSDVKCQEHGKVSTEVLGNKHTDVNSHDKNSTCQDNAPGTAIALYASHTSGEDDGCHKAKLLENKVLTDVSGTTEKSRLHAVRSSYSTAVMKVAHDDKHGAVAATSSGIGLHTVTPKTVHLTGMPNDCNPVIKVSASFPALGDTGPEQEKPGNTPISNHEQEDLEECEAHSESIPPEETESSAMDEAGFSDHSDFDEEANSPGPSNEMDGKQREIVSNKNEGKICGGQVSVCIKYTADHAKGSVGILVGDKKQKHTLAEGSTKQFNCDVCQKALCNKQALEFHKLSHTDSRPFQCDLCGKGFNHPSTLKRHAQSHLKHAGNLRTYECSKCKKIMSSKQALKFHMNSHSDSKPYKCGLCDKGFAHPSGCKHHMDRHLAKLKVEGWEHQFEHKCTVCSKVLSSKQTLKFHMISHENTRPFQCSQCGKSFNNPTTLKRHEFLHSGELSWKCNICGKEFSSDTGRSRHMRTHTGERPEQCTICGQTFSQKSTLNGHMLTHSRKPPEYECRICHKQMKRKNAFLVHMALHENPKPFPCRVCSIQFNNSAARLRHERAEHQQVQHFSCPLCPQNFSSRKAVVRHLDSHPDKKCTRCQLQFTESENFVSHLRLHFGNHTFVKKDVLNLGCLSDAQEEVEIRLTDLHTESDQSVDVITDGIVFDVTS